MTEVASDTSVKRPGTGAARRRVRIAPRFGERLAGGWRAFVTLCKDPQFAGGLTIFVLLVLMAIFAPYLTHYGPYETDANLSLTGPSPQHWMGTDQLGRDMFSRVAYGARLSIAVSLSAVAITMVGGTVIGLFSGYLRGLTDNLLMRFMDIMLAFPGLVLALIAAAVLGPGIRSVIIAVGIGGIPRLARVVRGSVMSTMAEDYVLAARAIGAGSLRIMFRHILPNVIGNILVLSTLSLAFAVLAAAALSFLGVGVQPPTAEWGSMANDGRNVIVAGWWVALFPSLMICLYTIAVNLCGDILRDHFDATLRSRAQAL